MAVTRFLLISTHTDQTTGYAKVSHNLLKQLATLQPLVKVFHYAFHKNPVKLAKPMRPLPEGVSQYDATLNENPIGEGFGYANIQEYIDMVNPDIVMIYNDALVINKFILALGLMKEDAPKPSYKLWVYLDQCYNGLAADLLGNIDEHADHIFVFNDGWKEKLIKKVMKNKKTLTSFEHGIDRTVFKRYPQTDRAIFRKNLGIPDGATVFLNANRNTERKRLDLTVCSFVELLVRHPSANICLLFFTVIDSQRGGNYNLVNVYASELERRGLSIEDHHKKLMLVDTSSNTVFSDEAVNQIYNATDIGVNTSNGEGFGLCQLEHLATGSPQVVVDVGYYKAFMDETCGVFVKPTVIEYLPARFGIGAYSEVSTISDFADGMEKAMLLKSEDCVKKVERRSWSRVSDPFLEMVAQTYVKN